MSSRGKHINGRLSWHPLSSPLSACGLRKKICGSPRPLGGATDSEYTFFHILRPAEKQILLCVPRFLTLETTSQARSCKQGMIERASRTVRMV